MLSMLLNQCIKTTRRVYKDRILLVPRAVFIYTSLTALWVQTKCSCIFPAVAAKVAEWQDRKEAILRGEVSASSGTGEDPNIYSVTEEVWYWIKNSHASLSMLLAYLLGATKFMASQKAKKVLGRMWFHRYRHGLLDYMRVVVYLTVKTNVVSMLI